jgi:hypothetical protein
MEADNAGEGTLQKRAVDTLSRLPELARDDEVLIHAGRYASLDFSVTIGTQVCFVTVEQGRVVKVDSNPQKMRSSAFTLAAEPEDWDRFWQPAPEPGWHDLFAMNKRGHATIDGNLLPFMQNLQYFKDVMALPRQIWVKK